MNAFLESIGFIYILKTVIWIIAGESLFKPLTKKYITPKVDAVIAELTDWRRVNHYIQKHEGKSYNCVDCKLGTPRSVDGLNSH